MSLKFSFKIFNIFSKTRLIYKNFRKQGCSHINYRNNRACTGILRGAAEILRKEKCGKACTRICSRSFIPCDAFQAVCMAAEQAFIISVKGRYISECYRGRA